MDLPLYIVTNRKQAVSGIKSLAPINPSALRFFNGDQINLAVYLLKDATEPTVDEPYETVSSNLSMTVAIANQLKEGSNQVLLARGSLSGAQDEEERDYFKGSIQITKNPEGSETFTGVDKYFEEPAAWDSTKTDYSEHDEVCFEGIFYRALIDAPSDGIEPPLNGSHWVEFPIVREQLYLGIILTSSGDENSATNQSIIFQEPITVEQSAVDSVVVVPPTNPTDGADFIERALLESATIKANRLHAQTIRFRPASAFEYQRVVWALDGNTVRYYQATRKVHFPVVAVSTTNIDLDAWSSGGPVGGVTIEAGDHFLLTGQTDTSENGIYFSQTGNPLPVRVSNNTYETGMMVRIGEANNAPRYWLATRHADFGSFADDGSPPELTWELAPGSGTLAVTEDAYFEEVQTSYVGAAWDASTTYSLGDIVEQGGNYYKYIYNTDATATDYDDLGHRNYWAGLRLIDVGAQISIEVKIDPNQSVLRETQAGLTVQLPPAPVVPVAANNTPNALSIGSTGGSGSSAGISRWDHTHPMPDFATETTGGFMSTADKAALNRVRAMPSALSAIGFDGAVHALAWTGRKIVVGGAFSSYGQITRNRLATLGFDGSLDSVFDLGSGFNENIDHLAIAGDGDIVAAHRTASPTYQGGSSARVWKIDLAGDADTSFTAPDPISAGGTLDSLESIAPLGVGHLVFLTPRTIRMTDLDGNDVSGGVTSGTDRFYSLASIPGNTTHIFVSSRSHSGAGVEQSYRGVAHPRGLRLIDPDAPLGSHLDETFETNAGVGAGSAMNRMAVASPIGKDAYVVVGAPVPATTESGVNHSWAGGNASLFVGLYKIGIDGHAIGNFDVAIEVATAGAAPIPFFVDGAENIYFGGNVSSINGTPVTPNRLYKINKEGEFIRQFNGFNGIVRAAIAPLNDDFIVVGGDFTEYHDASIGYFCFIDSKGALIQFPTSGIARHRGVVQTVRTLPTEDQVESDPTLALNVFIKDGNPPSLHAWNRTSSEWNDLRQMLNQVVSDVKVSDVAFSPSSGSAQATSPFEVTLSCQGYSAATIYYTTDGSDPTRASTEYSAPFEVSTPVTIKAFAVLAGYRDSNITRARYETDEIETLPSVSFSPANGTSIPSRGTLKITLSVAGHDDATIQWRDHFRDPAGIYRAYSAPITLSTETTIVAYGEKNGFEDGPIQEASFLSIRPLPYPVIEPRYSAGLLIGYKIKCDGADRLFYKIHNRPGEITSINHWDHIIETARRHNGGIQVVGDVAIVDLTRPVSFPEKGIQVFGSSEANGLSPIAGLNIL